MAAKPGTIDSLASYMISGYYRDEGEAPRHWQTSGGAITVNLSGLTGEGQALARAALDAWEMVADLRFQETSGGADITFGDGRSGASTSTSYYPSTGEMISASVNIGASWLGTYGTTVGSYSFQTYLHETGHALGLGHTGTYGGGATYAEATWANDSWQRSVMSYLDQNENPNVRADKAYVASPMMADIVAIQALYGAPRGGATAGDTTWGAGSKLPGHMKGVFGPGPGDVGRNALTIFDEGGTDTLDLSSGGAAQVIDLTPGAFSSSHGQLDNIGITRNTVIERAHGGSGADSITGNGAANLLKGNDGADKLYGGDGADDLYGGEGRDRLHGGAGGNRLWGEKGDDLLQGGGDGEVLYGGAGADSLYGGGGGDRAHGDGGADHIDGGEGHDRAWGDAGDDRLVGGNGDDQLAGGAGSDVLAGGADDDRLIGGGSHDTFVYTSGADVVLDFEDDVDTLVLDDALWGGRSISADRVLDFARVSGGDVVFDFGQGDTLRVEGLKSAALLLDDIGIA